jgi:hypothetical protein
MDVSNSDALELFDSNEQDPVTTCSQPRYGVVGELPFVTRRRTLCSAPSADDQLCYPPLGDLSRCSPSIVVPLDVSDPHTALSNISRSPGLSDCYWATIKQVRREAFAQLADTGDSHSVAKTLLLVREHTCNETAVYAVAEILKTLETSLAESVGKIAHEMAVEQHWLNKNGPRDEFLRGCEAQIETPLTPRLRSRLLLTYHKIYGSAKQSGRALFNSKSYAHNLRKGYSRPVRDKPRGSRWNRLDPYELDTVVDTGNVTGFPLGAVEHLSRIIRVEGIMPQSPSTANGNIWLRGPPNAMIGSSQPAWQDSLFSFEQPLQWQPFNALHSGDWDQRHYYNAHYPDSDTASWCPYW